MSNTIRWERLTVSCDLSIRYRQGPANGAENASRPSMDLQALMQDVAQDHPPERALARYVSNEMGLVRKKKQNEHLQECSECRSRVGNRRELTRRLRDFERVAITRASMPPCSAESGCPV
jgi:hypothetical protein